MSEEFIIRIGANVISDQISPYKIFSPDYEIARAMFAPLFKAKRDFTEILPNIVESYSFDYSNNEYIFSLREDVYFHNGRNVIAKDLEFSMVRGMLQGARRMFSQLLSCIEGYDEVCNNSKYSIGMCKGITVYSKYKLKIKLKKTNTLFLKYFTRSCMSIVPIEEFEEDNLWVWRRYPIGVGAYKFDFMDSNHNYLVLKKFDKYFENHKNAPSKLIFTKYKNVNELDIFSDVESMDSKEFVPLKTPIPMAIAIEHFMLNDNDESWKDLRYLINSAIDREELISCLSEDRANLYNISTNFVPKDIIFMESHNNEYEDFGETKNKLLIKWGEIPRINVLIYQNYSEGSDLRKLQLKLYNVLCEKGLDVKKVNLSSLTQKLNLDEHNILLSSSSFNYVDTDDISLFFGDKREVYRADTEGLKNIRILIEEAKQEIDKDKILELYKKVMELIYENQIILPIAMTNEYYFIRKEKMNPESFLNEFFQPAYEYLKNEAKWINKK